MIIKILCTRQGTFLDCHCSISILSDLKKYMILKPVSPNKAQFEMTVLFSLPSISNHQVTWIPTVQSRSGWPPTLQSSWRRLGWPGLWQPPWWQPPAASSSRSISCHPSCGLFWGMSTSLGTRRYSLMFPFSPATSPCMGTAVFGHGWWSLVVLYWVMWRGDVMFTHSLAKLLLFFVVFCWCLSGRLNIWPWQKLWHRFILMIKTYGVHAVLDTF